MDAIDRVIPFRLYRLGDTQGISGTGWIGTGAVFPSGLVIFQWRPPQQSITIHTSLLELDQTQLGDGLTMMCMDTDADTNSIQLRAMAAQGRDVGRYDTDVATDRARKRVRLTYVRHNDGVFLARVAMFNQDENAKSRIFVTEEAVRGATDQPDR